MTTGSILDDAAKDLDIGSFALDSYLEYARYVLLDRALPFLGDGLKPVQRRILYAMDELGLKPSVKPKKSARTVGDVIGKFHPHGDSAAYESMVLMAQDFSSRYPLIEGQGNWGSADAPGSFAAMRYTEARLTSYALSLLEELDQNATLWQMNFDNTLKEPAFLPARLPHLLLNGATGIAVGMVTDIPSHNLCEVADACILLLKDPNADQGKLLELIKGPDYPGSAPITSHAFELAEFYQTGKGSVRQRAYWHQEKNQIVISALPHQISASKVIVQIVQLMDKNAVDEIADVRDESNLEQSVRIVVVVRKRSVDADLLMRKLFAFTDLEKSHRVNLNLITHERRPSYLSLKEILEQWLSFRKECLKRRIDFQLETINKRLELFFALKLVFLNLDLLIEILRNEDDPLPRMQQEMGLSSNQCQIILNTKLRSLRKLEREKILAEIAELEEKRDELLLLKKDPEHFRNFQIADIEDAKKRWGDERRCAINPVAAAKEPDVKDFLPVTPIYVQLLNNGWVKSSKTAFGSDDPSLDTEVIRSISAFSDEQICVLDACGKVYPLTVSKLKLKGASEPLSALCEARSGSLFVDAISMRDLDEVLIASSEAKGMRIETEKAQSARRSGKQVLVMADSAHALAMALIESDSDVVVMISSTGYMLIVPSDQIPVRAQGRGVHLMRLAAGEELVAAVACNQKKGFTIHSQKRSTHIKAAAMERWFGKRASKGSKLPRGFGRVTHIQVAGQKAATVRF